MHKFRIEFHGMYVDTIMLVMFLDGEEVYRGSAPWTSTQAGLFRINPLRVIEEYLYEQQEKSKELLNLVEYDLEGVELVIAPEKVSALQESLATLHKDQMRDQMFPPHCGICDTPLDAKKAKFFRYSDSWCLCPNCDDTRFQSREF